MANTGAQTTTTLQTRILSGSLVMLVGSGVVSLVNFGYNIAVARGLGPRGFGHAAAALTLLMLGSAITLSFQLVCAKLIARSGSTAGRAAIFSRLLRRAWLVGILLGAGLALLSGVIAGYLNLPSKSLVLLLAAGIAFYVPLGVKRGGFQGVCAFSRLTVNFLLEVLVKFAAAIWFIRIGWGVMGAVGAIVASVVLAYAFPLNPGELKLPRLRGAQPFPLLRREGTQAIVFFVGQVVINNIDILLVKHFFQSEMAGVYAAIALVGRVVYMLAWSVVSAMFPISAGANLEKEGEAGASVVAVPLAIVVGITAVFVAVLGLFPGFALRAVFGAGFAGIGRSTASMLVLYAATTGIYALSVVLITYEMSRKLVNSGYVQLFFSGAIIAGICAFHATLRQVVLVQLALMVLLLAALAVPIFGRLRMATSAEREEGRFALRQLRLVTEAEVISSFLRNEFHHPEFDTDRERFHALVMNANTENECENSLRRALLFRRRGTMWRELPADTQWWEVDVPEDSIARLRVFPRAQWRKLASGSFLLSDIVERIRSHPFSGRTEKFIKGIQRLSERLRAGSRLSTVLLIGIDERQPLTILEGNHRITAAMMVSPRLAHECFRFYCGFSPRMSECCWYQTNLATLYRYALNRLKIVIHDREADLARLLTLSHPPAEMAGVSGGAAAEYDDPEPTRRAS